MSLIAKTGLLLLLLWASVLQAQQHHQSKLYNGREYLRYRFPFFSGSPYFGADSLTNGTVVYDGEVFTNIPLLFDQVMDELITYEVQGVYLVRLVKQKVKSFTIHGADFLHVDDAYYQVMDSAGAKWLKKETKNIAEVIRENENRHYIQSRITYISHPKTVEERPLVAEPDTANTLVSVKHERQIRSRSDAPDAEAVGSLREGKVSVLEDVVVYGERLSNVKGTHMGVQKIDIKAIRRIPAVLGEADVLRVVTSLPGVKTVGEASTGLNVRGGSADQNLILFNDVTVYNPSHFFGMFSAFNPDLVKDLTLYKSSVPARYGGRLSSVLEIQAKEGDKKQFAGVAGIGPLTSRVTIEGPLWKEKTSYIVGGRTTYANWLMNLLPDEYKNSRANFYDLSLVIDHEFDKRNSLVFTGYVSRDRFNLNSDTFFTYQNQNASLRWKHIFNNKLHLHVTGGVDAYAYDVMSDRNPINAYRVKFSIQQYHFRSHFNVYFSSTHALDFGLNTIRYRLAPGAYLPVGDESLVAPVTMNNEHALESAVYVNDRFDITGTTTLEAGLRFSVFNFLGPADVNTYTEGKPKSSDTFEGVQHYGKGSFVKNYGGPEYRIALRQMIGLRTSIKAAFNTQRQYIHMMSNTAAMAPTDVWKLSDANIAPQYGEQVSLGIYRNFKSNTIEASIEVYYKKIRDYLDYKSGANLIVNSFIEADVIGTRGKAYGAEFLLKKATGRLNGWVGYTWSRILLQQADTAVGELINEGKYYPANYDKPHDFTLVGNYRINHRFSVSLSAAYSTGRPITLPIGRFYYAGSYRTLYDKRNEHRIPDYFRTDLSMNIDGNHKKHQKTHNSWTIGVYNLTGRKNPFSVYYVSQGGAINGYKLSIFGSAIPFVTYNIRFNP